MGECHLLKGWFMNNLFSKFAASVAVTALAVTPALAEKASQLSSINGALGRDAEPELQRRGFAHVSTNRNSQGYVYSYWWDERDDDCVQVEVYNGRVETISDASDQDCGHHTGGGDAATGVAVIAGAALLGALFSHRSSHHEDGQHSADQQTEADYERGYNDGLHNASYHNNSRSDAYSSGYSAGVDERNANMRHHSGRGGYAQYAQINDLQGARAAGGMDELERRGFTQVDNFTSGDTRYSIQWKADTRQCVQVTIADGHFYDLRDVGQNPKCR